ncbi:MAG TPA: MFS transporter [Candidatus Angelobacter sp.]|nr:MFS transporter [Candidatus Angelobacter sp.]
MRVAETLANAKVTEAKPGYNRFLLLVAGLGGLLFGVDVGIIAGALPYLQDTSQLSANQLSFIVAAVFLGGGLSTLFAGILADLFGRKTMMIFSGLLFVLSVPIIAWSQSYTALITGRLLQGISGGMIGVVVPLYLAECLSASNRGKGTGIFQWLLTLGILAAAIIGFYFSGRVEEVARLGDTKRLLEFKDMAWRSMFWVSLPPGILFVIGGFFVSESPRWLFRRDKKDAASRALLRSRSPEQAAIELKEMEDIAAGEKSRAAAGVLKDSLFQRKYVLPFALACIILACNQATGVNSIIGYNATILIQAGLSDTQAHLGYVLLTLVNFLTTIGGVALVDRKGRKFLFSLGTGGIIVSMLITGFVFRRTEIQRVDVRDAVQTLLVSSKTAALTFNDASAAQWLGQSKQPLGQPKTLIVIYSYGDFTAASKVVRSDDPNAKLVLDRESCLPASKASAFVKNPFANFDAARTAPLKIDHAFITPVPSRRNGWLTAILIYCFMAFFAVGPGVCVWLALSELMPTRIRSMGMSIALFFNILISTTIAAIFLPMVGAHGYSTMFFIFAGCTVIYFLTTTFVLPETKGKTLEEIERHFEGGH